MFWQMQLWCIRKDERERMKDEKEQKFIAACISFFPFHFHLLLSFFILHHSSLVLSARPGSRLGRGIAQLGRHTFHLSSPPNNSLWATGHSHLALPKGESLHGGDSQAQVFVGSGYSSLPSSSRANLYFLMERLGDVAGSIPGGMTESVK